ncbi:MAG: DUF433 domain-containing protein [Fimbriimonadales bacterium]|nr:DUF433 domain-containing protein [Fimbriimonadales bacterium]
MTPAELLEQLRAPDLPLRLDESGALRVGDTRVTLETILAEFQQGSSPEMIVLNYPTLQLEQVYALLTYYLYNRTVFETYLQEAERAADQWFNDYETQSGVKELRHQILSRGRSMLGGRVVNVGK